MYAFAAGTIYFMVERITAIEGVQYFDYCVRLVYILLKKNSNSIYRVIYLNKMSR